jgi:hypothetical protein
MRTAGASSLRRHFAKNAGIEPAMKGNYNMASAFAAGGSRGGALAGMANSENNNGFGGPNNSSSPQGNKDNKNGPSGTTKDGMDFAPGKKPPIKTIPEPAPDAPRRFLEGEIDVQPDRGVVCDERRQSHHSHEASNSPKRVLPSG